MRVRSCLKCPHGSGAALVLQAHKESPLPAVPRRRLLWQKPREEKTSATAEARLREPERGHCLARSFIGGQSILHATKEEAEEEQRGLRLPKPPLAEKEKQRPSESTKGHPAKHPVGSQAESSKDRAPDRGSQGQASHSRRALAKQQGKKP